MTRDEWLLALHCLASVEACAAAEVGDVESFRWLVGVAYEALDQVGDGWAGALERAGEWLASRNKL